MQKKQMDFKSQITREAIKNTLKELICEKKISSVTVKELTKIAGIRIKTFYFHYESIKALFEDILQETSKRYFDEVFQTHPPVPIINVNSVFFTYLSNQDTLTERLFCSESYRDFCSKLILSTLQRIRNQYNPYAHLPKAEQTFVNIFISQSSINMYCKWVSGGKKIPLERLIELSSMLVNNGVESLSQILL